MPSKAKVGQPPADGFGRVVKVARVTEDNYVVYHRRVIELVAQGFTNKEIASELGTSEHTIKNRLRTIYDKLGFSKRLELALWYETRRHEGLF